MWGHFFHRRKFTQWYPIWAQNLIRGRNMPQKNGGWLCITITDAIFILFWWKVKQNRFVIICEGEDDSSSQAQRDCLDRWIGLCVCVSAIPVQTGEDKATEPYGWFICNWAPLWGPRQLLQPTCDTDELLVEWDLLLCYRIVRQRQTDRCERQVSESKCLMHPSASMSTTC